ncbi:MAG: T9SS type A sorting domain-containing protein [Saprospiraceae bacterium]|nr:T9SS type A sorting domain-containing protein [Saprospiraceae bacterium]
MNAQNDTIIELGVSYDHHFANQFTSEEDAIAYISEIVDTVNCIYSRKSPSLMVQISILRKLYHALPITASAHQRRLQATAFWFNQIDLCNTPDLAMHLTIQLPGVAGQASGGACNITRNGGVGIAEADINNVKRAANIFAHEMGHMLGMSHEEDIPGNSDYCVSNFGLMCDFVNPKDCNKYVYSTHNNTSYANKINNSTCLLQPNVDVVDLECPNCSQAVVITNTSQNDFYVDFGCEEEIPSFELEGTISNNCENLQNDRQYRIYIDYNDNYIDIVESESIFAQVVPYPGGNPEFNSRLEMNWMTLPRGSGAINSVKVRPKGTGQISNGSGFPNYTRVNFVYNINPEAYIVSVGSEILPLSKTTIKSVQYRFNYNHQIDKTNQSYTTASELTNPNENDIYNFCYGTKFDVYLDGIFDIDVNKAFCNTNFYFTPDSRLLVRDGVTLDLNECSFNSCGEKWNGITLEGSGKIILKKSTLSNANIGITSDSRKAVVRIEDGCLFDGNHTAISLLESRLEKLSGSVFRNGQTGIILTNCPVVLSENCDFRNLAYGVESNGTSLKVEGGNFEGKSLFQGKGINLIGEGNNLNVSKSTTFSRWQTGIVSARNIYESNGTIFDNNTIGTVIINSPGLKHDIYKNTFRNGQRGIISTNNSGNDVYSRIDDSDFDNLDVSLSITGQSGAKGWFVWDSDFTNVKQRGISLNNSFNNYVDENRLTAEGRSNSRLITVEGSSANIINYNTLNNLSATNESSQRLGIYLSGSMGNVVQCNNIQGGTYGINVWGNSNGNYNRNTMSSSHTGLYCGLYPSNGLSLMGQQMHRFNFWENGTFTIGAKHLGGDIFFVNESQFIVDNSQDSRYRPNPISSVSTDWFINQATGSTSTSCSGSPNGGGSYNIPGPLENDDNYDIGLIEDFVGGDFNFGAFNAALNFSADFRIYNAVKNAGQDSLFKNVPNIHSFIAAHSAGNIGKLYEASSLIRSSRYADTSLTDAIDTLKSLWTNYNIDQPHLTEQQQLLRMEDIYVADSTVKVIYTNIRDQHLHDIDDALIILNNIYDTLTPVLNQIAILRAVASLHQNDTLTLTEWQTLTEIAVQCPLSGGESVYAARGLLESKADSVYYNDHDLCDTTVIRTAQSYQLVSIQPNPSSGIFTIYAPDPIQTVSVYDLHGRIWIHQSGEYGNMYQLDAKELHPGLYFIKLECDNNDKIYTSKIIKIE